MYIYFMKITVNHRRYWMMTEHGNYIKINKQIDNKTNLITNSIQIINSTKKNNKI